MVRLHNERVARGRNNQAGGERHWKCGQLQEQQDGHNQTNTTTDNKSKEPAMDGSMHGPFRVSVTLLVSDERDRDGDGMYSTIQDCLIAAIGRLAQMDRLALRKLAKSEERRRGI